MTKPLHAGRAAENGEWGFFQVLGGGADVPRIAAALGSRSRASSRASPSSRTRADRSGIRPMDAMLTLVTEHDVKPEQVVKVRVRAGSNILNPLRYRTAKTELEAKFCLPFMMASIVLRRRAGIREFTDEFTRADVHAKFSDCASLVLPAPRIARALELIESVEQLKNIRELTLALA